MYNYCLSSGAGFYVAEGVPENTALPNNGLVMANDESTLRLRCRSGTTLVDVGEFIGLNETALDGTTNPFIVKVSPSNNPGLMIVRTTSLTSADDQGVYTCRIPDERNNSVDINIGIYLNGFNSESLRGIYIA